MSCFCCKTLNMKQCVLQKTTYTHVFSFLENGGFPKLFDSRSHRPAGRLYFTLKSRNQIHLATPASA